MRLWVYSCVVSVQAFPCSLRLLMWGKPGNEASNMLVRYGIVVSAPDPP